MRWQGLIRPTLVLLVLHFFGPSLAGSSLAAGLQGRVFDRETGDELIGVDVVLIGTGLRTQSDIEGMFAFEDLEPGTYELRLTYLGYNARIIGDIEIAAGDTPFVKAELESFKAHDGGELVVSGTRIMNTETALLAERKQSVNIGDGISAAQISQSPDGTGGEALKRVTGLTVTDGKYVIVRGMPDRYNVTELDEIPVTGTDVTRDRKSFSFDMVPASLLANLQVVKSRTPDMPGDVTGGLVEVNTLEFPEKAVTSVGVSAGSIAGSTGEEYLEDSLSGSDDWRARDDGSRALPEIGEEDDNNDLARALPNAWTSSKEKAKPKTSFSLAHGNKVRFAGLELGFIGALNYRNKYERTDVREHRQGFEDILVEGTESQRKILWGGLGNVFLRLGKDHKIGVRNVYTRSAENEVYDAAGRDSDTEFVRTNLVWQERFQVSHQLAGTHYLDSLIKGLDFDWKWYYGEAQALEPDNRFVEYNTDNPPPEPPTMSFNRRSWTTLDDAKRGYRLNLTYSFADFDFEEDYAVKLKAGVAADKSWRTYNIDNYYSNTTRFSSHMRQYPIDQIFAPENYSEEYDERRGRGLNFIEELAMSGDYDATHFLDAYYGMAVVPLSVLGEDLNLVGGVRVEESDQNVLAVYVPSSNSYVDSVQVRNKDTLPSVNLTWNYDVDLNLRMAYFESVNRPEFRELAPVSRRNYVTIQNERGNADLKRSYVKNYDIRLEYFPRSGELISASYFIKKLTDPIEEELTPTAEGPLLSWTNSPKAENKGFELEVRRKLDFLRFTRNFTAKFNYTRVYSVVDFYDTYDGVDSTRPLQGQAPWVINAGLMFEQPQLGLTLNLLYYNKGRSLKAVGDNRDTDVYVEPWDVLDFVAVKKFGPNLKVKLAVKNVFDTEGDLTSGGVENEAYVYSKVFADREVSLSLSAKF